MWASDKFPLTRGWVDNDQARVLGGTFSFLRLWAFSSFSALWWPAGLEDRRTAVSPAVSHRTDWTFCKRHPDCSSGPLESPDRCVENRCNTCKPPPPLKRHADEHRKWKRRIPRPCFAARFYGFTLGMKSGRRRASGVGGSSEDIVRVQESASSGEAGKGKQLNKFGLIFFPEWIRRESWSVM